MARGEDPLELAARGGSIGDSQWPDLLERIVLRLDHIVYNEFPIPTIPFTEPLPSTLRNDSSTLRSFTPTSASQQSQKENAPPGDPSTPKASSPSASQSLVPDSLPSSIDTPPATLPPQLLSSISSIKKQLATSFDASPPYTIQRFSELILRPTAHYRTLPSYIRALDRVLSVSSSASDFPLPNLGPEPQNEGNYLAAGAPSLNADDFNGAALTRIPWLRGTGSMLLNSERTLTGDLRTESTSLIDGPNGAGSLETVTVSVNGMSSLPRNQDLLVLGPALTSEASHAENEAVQSGRMTRSSTAQARKEEEDEERVHVRGPEEIGMEDMGPQASQRVSGGFDAEAALGRPGEGEEMGHSAIGVEVATRGDEEDIMERVDDADGDRNENDENGQQTLVDTSAL